MRWYWLSTPRITVAVLVDHQGIVRDGPPIIWRHRGGRARALCYWLRERGGRPLWIRRL